MYMHTNINKYSLYSWGKTCSHMLTPMFTYYIILYYIMLYQCYIILCYVSSYKDEHKYIHIV